MKKVEVKSIYVVALLEEGDTTSIIIFNTEKEFKEFLEKQGFKNYQGNIYSNGHDLLEILFNRS